MGRWERQGPRRPPPEVTRMGSFARYDRPQMTYGEGRRCTGCGCILSRYNPAPDGRCLPCLGGSLPLKARGNPVPPIVRRAGRRWSPVEEQELRRLHAAGHSDGAIAAALDRAPQSVQRYRRRLGLEPNFLPGSNTRRVVRTNV